MTSGSGSLKSRMARSGSGCAVYVVSAAALAFLIDRYTATRLDGALRPWVGIAAAPFITLGLATVWGVLRGHTRSVRPEALLADATARGLPSRDGPLLSTGVVRTQAWPLKAPLSGTECVAYLYRMYYAVRDSEQGRREVPVYWGQACRPFSVASPGRNVRVAAVPMLIDKPVVMQGEAVLARSRAHIAGTQFEVAKGVIGAIGSAVAIVDDVFSDETCDHGAEVGREISRHWVYDGEPVDPSRLVLEETILAVGATVSVFGPWSAARQAIVPHLDGHDSLIASATAGPAERLLADGAGLPPSIGGAIVTAVVLLGSGAGIVWGALRLFRLAE